MYGVFGFSKNIQNIYRACSTTDRPTDVKTIHDLRNSYLAFIERYHRLPNINKESDPIIRDRNEASRLLKAYSGSALNDLQQEYMIGDFYDAILQDANIKRLMESLECLEKINIELATLFRLSIHSIAITGSLSNQSGARAHGGSTSSLIGLIWLTLRPELSTQDIHELLIHELTHTLVFIDELNHGHFNYENMAKREYWAQSAILNKARPMDKVIHSIAVGTEILHARARYLPGTDQISVHPASDVLQLNTLESIKSVLDHKNLGAVCLPRAVDIVETCRNHINQLKMVV